MFIYLLFSLHYCKTPPEIIISYAQIPSPFPHLQIRQTSAEISQKHSSYHPYPYMTIPSFGKKWKNSHRIIHNNTLPKHLRHISYNSTLTAASVIKPPPIATTSTYRQTQTPSRRLQTKKVARSIILDPLGASSTNVSSTANTYATRFIIHKVPPFLPAY